MKYEQPQITNVYSADDTIQSASAMKAGNNLDSQEATSPAYEADE
ncbi:hypothetical protein AB4Y89_19225 [Terriglobus sp. 2YAB30_2]